ncbi:MAG: endonuclease/exonuclease/phosphatase family protein [Actinomycetota bacterium]|nr:endonuclease/exonuclease/phosphatase family protein [Actinomycetota bacterium]
MPLRVLTINLWGDNPPLQKRMAALVAYLQRERPHLVALQEVADFQGRTQAEELAEAAGYPSVHLVTTGRLLWPGEGLAILAEFDVEAATTVALPHDLEDAHPRALQQVDVQMPDGAVIRVANTHLAFPLGAVRLRRQQTERILEELESFAGASALLGDLNDVIDSEPLRVLTAAGFVDCYAAVHEQEHWTFHPANPYAEQTELLERRVDHVLARGLEVVDAAVVLTGEDTPVVSDHYGVQATLDVASR